jgi:hypothetical protein
MAIAAFVLFMTVGGTKPSLACGLNSQQPCNEEKVRSPCYDSSCYYFVRTCNGPYAYINHRKNRCDPPPSYTIPAPQPVSFADKGGSVTDGYYVKIDLKQAWIVIPNLSQPTTCISNVHYPSATATVGPDSNDLTMPTWAASSEYRSRLAINGSYFEVDIPMSDPNSSHSYVCTTVFGYTVSNRKLVQKEQQILVYKLNEKDDVRPATLVFYTGAAAKKLHRQAEIKQYPMFPGDPEKVPASFQNAISGTPLLTGGNYVGDSVAQPDPECSVPRTAAGLTADGNTLILVVINAGINNMRCEENVNGGATLASLASYMKSLGAQDAINLDGGGSSQLYYNVPGAPPVQTKPSDYINKSNPTLYYRPVGNMLGIR